MLVFLAVAEQAAVGGLEINVEKREKEKTHADDLNASGGCKQFREAFCFDLLRVSPSLCFFWWGC